MAEVAEVLDSGIAADLVRLDTERRLGASAHANGSTYPGVANPSMSTHIHVTRSWFGPTLRPLAGRQLSCD